MAALSSLGVSSVEAFGSLSGITGKTPKFKWSDWAGDFEGTLSNCQGGSNTEDTSICFLEGGAAANETSRGALTGTNLIFTQSGAVPAATGNPPYRTFTKASSQYMQSTATWVNTMMTATTGWLVLVKMTYTASDDGSGIIYFWNGNPGQNQAISITTDATGKLVFYVEKNDIVLLNSTTTDALSAGTTYYIVIWGYSTLARGGFTAVKPTKWSNFEANKRVTASVDASFNGFSFNKVGNIMTNYNQSLFTSGNLYYLIASKVPASFINDAG